MNKLREPWRGHPLKTRQQLEILLNNTIAFGSCDGTKAFWQIPIAEESKQYHVMWTPVGHFRFNVLSMGEGRGEPRRGAC